MSLEAIMIDLRTAKPDRKGKFETIEIRLFKCDVPAKHADVLNRRNGIVLPADIVARQGFRFTNKTSRPCTVDAEFFDGILGAHKRKFVNPNYVRDSDISVNDDGEIDFRHDLPPERVLQLFWLQCIAEVEMQCKCELCLTIAASNAGL